MNKPNNETKVRDGSTLAVKVCREHGCNREATHHRPGFGENFWHCEEHDKRNADFIKSGDYWSR